MTQIDADWLRAPDAQALLRALEDDGHQALFVGGCVRNTLIGDAVSDIDVSTSATPHQVVEIANRAGFVTHPTGIDHGTITVVTPSKAYEVTTFRKDVATDGRRAVVAFAKTIEEDARRRDFTVNALYARRDGMVIDPLGGLSDLSARRIRFIEDPAMRIREDYLRILRFFRFFAHYGDPAGGLDPDGLAACAANAEGLERLSKERIGAEMLKLLAAPDPSVALAAMEASGCLARVLPGAKMDAVPVLVHLEDGLAPDPIRRLAALGADDARDLLRLSNAHARELAHVRGAATGSDRPAELAYRIGLDQARDAILVRSALLVQPLPPDLERDLAIGADASFPIKASDLHPLAGPALGAKLRELEARWIASGFTMGRDALLK